MKRRDALKMLGTMAGVGAAAKVLPGCSSSDDGPKGITTYVYMMMENRSYDHYFGARKLVEGVMDGDGLTPNMMNKDRLGVEIPIYMPDMDHECVIDPPHDWDNQHNNWDSTDGITGKCDGFVISHQNDHDSDTAIEPMQYHTRDHLPVSYALADAYSTADRWFCSVMGPTWPNRFYWMGGTSRGVKDNSLPTGGSGGGIAGPSIFHRLNDAGIDWGYYYGNIPVAGLIADLPSTRADGTTYIDDMKTFFKRAKAGKLPPVVYIDPAFNGNDDHPPVHPINGQELIAAVYQALAESPQWKNIMFVITYDENGGFFDHVSPPQTMDDNVADGFGQMGFRVPTMVMGPYVKQGYVSHTVYDHTSALAHLINVFGLEPLTMRSSAANDLTDFIDMDRLAKNDWAKPIAIPDVDITQWPMGAVCTSDGTKTTGRGTPVGKHAVEVLADQYPELIAKYDRRKQEPEYRRMITEFLASRAGRKL